MLLGPDHDILGRPHISIINYAIQKYIAQCKMFINHIIYSKKVIVDDELEFLLGNLPPPLGRS